MNDHMTTRSLLYVTTYDRTLGHLGGAAWVDNRILNEVPKSWRMQEFVVTNVDPEPVELEVRSNKRLLAATLARMALHREPYITAKFRQSRNWTRRIVALQRAAASTNFVVTSQWPALLLALDAGIQVDVHIAHNVDYLLSELHDPLPLRALGNARRTKRAELQSLKHARKTLALSSHDRERLVAHGVDSGHLLLTAGTLSKPKIERTRQIGFIGKASWPPNQVALNSLRNEVLPAVRDVMGADAPGLIVAGRGMQDIEGLNVETMGEVDNVADFYERIDLVVIPRGSVSSGVSVKMLEALDYGVHVIAPDHLVEAVGNADGCESAASLDEITTAIVRHYREESPDVKPTRTPAPSRTTIEEFWRTVGDSRR
ncbi:hypothetical protein J2X85_001950 [Microbacterium trichothecenolyticum]|uniref:glycosyltransferase n=1 Tax=Microbacterium trichothecenolyticum TaxID=69370 RepID=UPI00285DE0FE|nr:glycosyltransferase [Microbacterium trichothecenolyticum]MDR7184916.1 hypothetical protein [Microbacterium trichothecenolyticum]